MLTSVKTPHSALTSSRQAPPNSHLTPTNLPLLGFRDIVCTFVDVKKPNLSSNYYFISIMGKVTSLYGKTTGKIGSIVFATSGGETIAREYNPHVANPNTISQINQRARLKLMSQLSACLAPSIVMQKEGLVSRRNKFTKKNMNSCYAENGVAQITYENVQLTEGSIGLPQIVGGKTEDTETGDWSYEFKLAQQASSSISRVVWSLFQKTDEGTLALITSAIVERATDGLFAWDLAQGAADVADPYAGMELVIYAYGMADTSEAAAARYGNLNVQNGSDLATLVANRTISYQDYQFSRTRGATIGVEGTPINPTPEGQARVFVTALGDGGTVTGGGTFEIGSTVQVSATPATNYTFRAWLRNGTNQVVSTDNPYSFTLNGQTDLIAAFDYQGNDTL